MAELYPYTKSKSLALGNYRIVLGFAKNAASKVKALIFVVEQVYSLHHEKYVKRTGYSIQYHQVDGKNGISTHKRVQTLKKL